MAKKLSRGAKIGIGVVAGFGVALLISTQVQAAVGQTVRAFFRRKPPEDDDELEEDPEPGTAKKSGAGATRASTKVPGKTGTGKFNMSMFPSDGAVMGTLAGLSPSAYSAAQFEETFPAAVGAFQADWNTLAEAGLLLPKRLNSSRLKQDEDPGPQTKRALEWAVGMDWPQRLDAVGLQA